MRRTVPLATFVWSRLRRRARPCVGLLGRVAARPLSGPVFPAASQTTVVLATSSAKAETFIGEVTKTMTPATPWEGREVTGLHAETTVVLATVRLAPGTALPWAPVAVPVEGPSARTHAGPPRPAASEGLATVRRRVRLAPVGRVVAKAHTSDRLVAVRPLRLDVATIAGAVAPARLHMAVGLHVVAVTLVVRAHVARQLGLLVSVRAVAPVP